MSADPVYDFFSSGGDATSAPSGDPTHDFFSTGKIPGETASPPTTYDANLFRKRVGRDPEPAELANFKAMKGVGWAGDPTQGKFTVGQAAIGGAEDALSLGTSIPASITAAPAYLAGLTGIGGTDSLSAARATRNAMTYQPRSEAGQAGMETIGQIKPGEIVPRLLDVSGHPQAADTVRDVTERVGDVAPLAGEVAAGFPGSRAVGRGAGRAISPMVDPESVPLTAQEVLTQAAVNSPQSMGAAAAAADLSKASPELKARIVREAQQTGGAVNAETMGRHIEADTLPVKIQLTPGQAMQDPAVISSEMNNRARTPGLPDLLNNQNKALGANIQAIRDQVGPDVFSTNAAEHGDTLIQAYKDKAKIANDDISAKYQALKDANGGRFPVDAKGLLDNASKELHQELLFDHAPKAVMSTLGRLADSGNMTFENFESLRTNLARIQRSPTADGNEKAAAGIIRSSMEQLPLAPGAASLKPLADTARAAAKAQFDAVKVDPAYNAAVTDSVAPDDFVRKYVIGGKRDDVATMRQNLADNPTATQTMGVAALDHLRDQAGVGPGGSGNFSQAAYNKYLQALQPKLGALVDPRTEETLEKLGNVARYTQAQPKGSYVNNSNTLVGALGEHALNAGENLLNAKTGVGGTLLRKAIDKRAADKAAKETMTPYGGMGRLSDFGKPPQ